MHTPVRATPTFTSQLPKPERVLLWSMRACVIGLKQRIDVAEAIRSALHKSNLPDATELIEALMSVVTCGATRTLVIECVCERAVSDDEHHLLAAAALHQAGGGFEARFVLRSMLSPAASRDAGEILDRLGALFAVGAFRLSSRLLDTERSAFHDSAAGSDRPTIH
jgi:hypothetical protein